MTYLLIVILHDLTRLSPLLKAWKKIGVPGVTLINSVGGYQAETWLDRIGLGGISRLFDQEEIRQRTLISVISDLDLLNRAIAEADTIVEGFDRPHSGVLFTVPVEHMLGIRKRGHAVQPAEAVTGNQPLNFDRHAPVSKILQVMDLKPVIVQTHDRLNEIILKMIASPNIHVACVVNDEQHLVGLIDLTQLANGFFMSVFPEKFIGEVENLDKMLRFASQGYAGQAHELMQEPAWVKAEDNLETAFTRMHEKNLPGLPVVDNHYKIVGYINLLELMGISMRGDVSDQGAAE